MNSEGGTIPNTPPLAEQLRICTDHAQDLIDASSAVYSGGKSNIAYHLAALALEEVGRHELLILEHGANRQPVPPSWPVKHRQDHVQKLFWAFFGAAFGRQVLTREQLEEMRDLARFIHETRMVGLYAEDQDGNVQVPRDAIPPAQAENLINIATARLGMARSIDPDAPISDDDRELQWWFLETSLDDRRRQFIFTGPSMTKLAELQDAKAWILWLKEQFDDADARGRAMIEAELVRSENLPATSRKKKWLLRFKLVSASHQVAPRALRGWNEKVEIIKLSSGPTRSELYVDLFFDETMPVERLWYAGWALARRFTVALNIGTRGFWWWHLAEDLSRYYEFIEDLDRKERIEMNQQPRLALDWGQNVLNDADLGLTMRCVAALPGPADPERLVPFDYYVAGLNFWALNDVHWRCELEVYGNFHESLKAMAARAGAWDRQGPFDDVMIAILQRLIPELEVEQRKRYIDLAAAFERKEPEGNNFTLTDVACIKVLCDRYFLDVVMPLEFEERMKAQTSA